MVFDFKKITIIFSYLSYVLKTASQFIHIIHIVISHVIFRVKNGFYSE